MKERTLLVLSLLSFHLSLVIGQSHFIPITPPTCPFSSSQFFNTVPQDEPLTKCMRLHTNESCCKQSYESSVLNGTDLISPRFSTFLSTLSPTCQEELSIISCMPCYHDSYVWAENLSSSYYKLTMCSNFCQRVYDSCTDSILASGSVVSSVYTNSEVFCVSLFQGSNFLLNVIPNTDINCFDYYNKECTADDIDYHYSDCIDGHRTLLYSWKFGVNCTGGIKLPNPVYNLNCPIDCDAGWYLALGTSDCRPCEAGTFSLGGGHSIQSWDSWPTRFIVFNTFCTDLTMRVVSNCGGWSLNGSYTESNIKGKKNTNSILETEVTILHNSSITFLSEVDCEYDYDRLSFVIDNDETWIKNSPIAKRYTFPLTTGHHRLRWIYSKDQTVDYGYDRAMIYMIEILGLADASDYCNECVAGTTSVERATECTDCPLHSYNSYDGSPTCITCSDNEYSFPGDTKCTLRKNCTENDYQYLFTECSEDHTRTKYYEWIYPQICIETEMSAHLPTTETNLPCAPCNPGQYRDADNCYPCPIGQYSGLGTEGGCTPCNEGTYAPKQLLLKRWDVLPEGSTTVCDGQCGTPGWRLRGSFIDSGTDHGGHVDSILYIPVVIEAEPFGLVSFTYTLNCQNWCFIELRSNGTFLYSSWNELFTSHRNITIGPFELAPGAFLLSWNFGKYFGYRNDDSAILWDIIIEGVDRGGAGECIVCPPGTASGAESESCQICQPGTYSPGNASACSTCDENMYQNLPQQGECKPCGHEANTPPGSAECGTNDCTYNPSGSSDHYDLKGLILENSMYGPIEESVWPPNYYYISPCIRQNITHQNASCIDEDGVPLNTFACQYNGIAGYSFDLGRVMGYYPYYGPEKGFIISFTEGTPGCGNPEMNQPDVPRRLNITIVCDPSAGIGTPETEGPVYRGTTYPNVCIYSLIWRSAYGCPVCTENDYISVAEVCQNNRQEITYVWKDNPPRCFGGVSLPPSTYVNCTSVISSSCGTGTYLSGDICAPCPSGQFSLGNGEVVTTNFTSTDLSPFTTGCNGDCETWYSQGGVLVSGGKGVSWLEFEQNFKSGIDDSIEFEYKYTAQGSPFSFYVDSKLVFQISKFDIGYNNKKIPVSIGSHKFRWEYSHGSLNFSTQRDNYVKIRNVKVRGITLAVTSCSPCSVGTVSDEDKGGCHVIDCPENTYPVGDECQPCEPGQYRITGQTQCYPALPCTINDFIEVYQGVESFRCGDANGSPFSSSYISKMPQICNGTVPQGQSISQCVPCPIGRRWDMNTLACLPCLNGNYLSNGECKQASPGYAVIKTSYYFTKGDIVNSISPKFQSECVGDCSSKWRIYSTYVDSGIHFGEVDSSLHLSVIPSDTYFTPTVTFTVTLHDAGIQSQKRDLTTTNSGIEFYVDDKIQEVPYSLELEKPQTFTFNIPKVSSLLTWTYSQSKDAIPRFVTLSDIKIYSTTDGTALEQIQCPAGTFADANGAKCTMCQAGTYSDAGATSCVPCPSGSISHDGASSCTICGEGTTSIGNVCRATCMFQFHNPETDITYEYNLVPLRGSIYTVTPGAVNDQHFYYEIDLCNKFFSENCYDDQCTELSYIFGEFGTSSGDWSMPYTMGTELKFVPNTNTIISDTTQKTFDLVYTEGKNLPEGCESVRTTISFICDPSEGRGSPEAVEVSNKCNTAFSWKSVYACHTCLESEKVAEVGACIDNTRIVSYHYSKPCNRAGNQVSTINEQCENINLARNTAIFAFTIVVFILSLGIGLAVYFFRQKKTLEAKYHQLKNETTLDDLGGDEMTITKKDQDIGLDDDEDMDLPVDDEKID